MRETLDKAGRREERREMLHYAFSRRWLGWHILCAVLAVAMICLGIWQWQTASAPHPPGAHVSSWRNYAYALNWWIFTGVAIWFWWRFMRDQRRVEQSREQQPE